MPDSPVPENMFAESTFQYKEGGTKERITFEILLYIQINRISNAMSSPNLRNSIDECVDCLDCLCDCLKDEKYENDTKLFEATEKKKIDIARETVNTSEAELDRKHNEDLLTNIIYHYYKQKFKNLMKLLRRKNMLVKNTSEGDAF